MGGDSSCIERLNIKNAYENWWEQFYISFQDILEIESINNKFPV